MSNNRALTFAPVEGASEEIASESARLVEQYNLSPSDTERLVQILDATKQPFSQSVLPPKLSSSNYYFSPSIEEAFKAGLSANDVLDLFERHLKELNWRIFSVYHLASAASPIYTLDELADLLSEFRAHLRNNRESLLETGLPLSNFSRSQWMDELLTPLYPCKLPCRVSATRATDGSLQFEYEWPLDIVAIDRFYSSYRSGDSLLSKLLTRLEETTAIKDGYTFKRLTSRGTQPSLASRYSDASLALMMTSSMASKLQRGRQSLFDVKMNTIETMLSHLSTGDDADMWRDAIKVISALTGSEVTFYIEAEDYCKRVIGSATDHHGWSARPELTAVDAEVGGLRSLLKAVSFVQLEMRTGPFDRIKRLLAAEGCPFPDRQSFSKGYFALWAAHGRDTVDMMCEQCKWAVLSHSNAEANANIKLFHEHLISDFEWDVSVTKRMRIEHAKEFKKRAEEDLTVILSQVRSPELPCHHNSQGYLIQPPSIPTQPDYGFCLRGEYFEIRFGGEECILKDSTGLRYIQHMLCNPDTDFEPPALDSITPCKLKSDCDYVPQHGVQVATIEERNRLRQQLRELSARRLQAIGDKNAREIAHCDEELQSIKKHLNRYFGKDGSPRMVGSDWEKKRQLVKNAISRALYDGSKRAGVGGIRAALPKLERHLTAFLRFEGGAWSYRPDDKLKWIT